MGLDLCVFDAEGNEDETGPSISIGYGRFNIWRNNLPRPSRQRFDENPDLDSIEDNLHFHSDSNGEWTYSECVGLKKYLDYSAEEALRLEREAEIAWDYAEEQYELNPKYDLFPDDDWYVLEDDHYYQSFYEMFTYVIEKGEGYSVRFL